MGRIFPLTQLGMGGSPLACCKTGCSNSRNHGNRAMHHSKFGRKHSNSELDLSSFMYNFLSKLLSRGFFILKKTLKSKKLSLLSKSTDEFWERAHYIFFP
jgi:hypothetical protein